MLDFGAGFGRQANLFYGLDRTRQYVAVDAVPYAYTLQQHYLRSLNPALVEYIDDPDGFVLAGPGLYHVPTWRHDLLPSNHFDLIIAVQVLAELSEKLATFAIDLFHRVLAPTGRLYIRDHAESGFGPSCANYILGLEEAGFRLDYRLDARDGIDVHGVPRCYVKDAAS